MQEATTRTSALVGIDLGTTNSVCAIWRDGKAHLIPNALGEVLTPSVISLDEDGRILIGKAAYARLTTHPERSVATFKRFMGSGKRFDLGNQPYSPEELSALVLGALKADAEAWLGHSVQEAVISVPAYFSDAQRKRTVFAAELAGLTVTRLINEPTAAAMAYGMHEQTFERTLIFDLGGGTFDVTVLEYALPLIEVHASTGDNFLGGEDFTTSLLQACLTHWQLSAHSLNPKALANLRESVEQLKCKLLQGPQHLSWSDSGVLYEWYLDNATAQRCWEPLLSRLRAPIEQALRDARLRPQELDNLVLVGGATRMQAIHHLVATLFAHLPYRHLDPDTLVALGAAAQAACKARDHAIEELILTDVCPYTLGVSSLCGDDNSGAFTPIIERNSVIPTSRVQRFYSTHPDQRFIRIEVYQGERPWVRDNIFIDAFDVPLSQSRDIQALDVRFSYDINGLLDVDVTLLHNNEHHTHSIDHTPSGLSPEARESSQQRLATLKVHPRDTLPNRTLLARLERAWEISLGEEREQIGQWLETFNQLLADQQPEPITRCRQQLDKALAQLDL